MMQVIEYPETRNIEGFLQKRGQLMGSVLSFPVLCILNFVTWALTQKNVIALIKQAKREKFDRENRLALLNSFPVLINGDDILFESTTLDYYRWCEVLKHVGFSKSVGKNLVSKSFVTINSQFYWVRGNGKVTKPTQGVLPKVLPRAKFFDFPNIGLIRGQSKLNNRDRANKPLWDIHNMVVQSALQADLSVRKESGERHDLFLHLFTKLFLYYNKEEIAEITSKGRFNLYLPRSLGGCGFVGDAKSYSHYQLQLASYLYRRHRRVGEVVDKDPGLISYGRSTLSKFIDLDKGLQGVRVPLFDVPKEGFRVKREPIKLSIPNGEAWDTSETYVRHPVEFDREAVKPVKIEKLKSFPDHLVTHVFVGYKEDPNAMRELASQAPIPTYFSKVPRLNFSLEGERRAKRANFVSYDLWVSKWKMVRVADVRDRCYRDRCHAFIESFRSTPTDSTPVVITRMGDYYRALSALQGLKW